MAHSGSFLQRQYCAFAGIARGQTSREFVARLVARGYAAAIIHGNVRRGRIYHVHHKLLYEAIGLLDDRHRVSPRLSAGSCNDSMILTPCWLIGTAAWMSPPATPTTVEPRETVSRWESNPQPAD